MNIDRLRRIAAYSEKKGEEIKSKAQDFCAFAGMSSDKEILNIMQIVKPSLQKKGYLVLEMPFADKEIGALCYRGDAQGYIVLNTSLPKVNVNFAICHEAYHVFYQGSEFKSTVEFANADYYEHDEELAANLFAGMILMPANGFRFMYYKFMEESGNRQKDTIVRLMNYYQAPYMAVLIRSCELGMPGTGSISERLLNMCKEDIKERFIDLWLDESILQATMKDDYIRLTRMVASIGKEYINDSYMNERTLRKALKNMQELYSDIKEEQ